MGKQIKDEFVPPADAVEFTPPADAVEAPSSQGAQDFVPPSDAVESVGDALNTVGQYGNIIFNRGLKTLISDVPQVAGRAAEAIGRLLPEGFQHKSVFTSGGEQGSAIADKLFPTNQAQENTLPGQIMSGLGSAGAIMATAGAGELGAGAGLLKATSTEVPSALSIVGRQLIKPTSVVGGSMTAAPEYDAAKRAGATDDEAFNTLLKNYFVGQTEALPIESMFGQLNKIVGGGITKNLNNYIKGVGQGGLTEALQEGVQTYLTNKIAQGDYDPDRDPMWGVADAMTVGGLVGMILPGVAGAIKSASPDARAKIERKVQELQAKEEATKQFDGALAETSTGDPALDKTVDNNAALTPDQLKTVTENKLTAAVEEGAIADKEKLDDINKEVDQADKQALKTVDAAVKEADKAAAEVDKSIKNESLTSEIENNATKKQQEAEEHQVKYDAAVSEVRALQERFAAADPEEDMGDLYRQLANAKHALLQIAGNPRTAPKTEAQKSIEKSTGVTAPEKSVTMTPAQAIKHQVQTFYKGMSEGVKKGADLKNELVTKVQEALKGADMTPGQVSTILTRLKKTNLFTAGSVSKLNQFIDKVSKNAQYTEQLGEASKLRSKIKTKWGAKDTTFREKEALKALSAIDPSEVDIDKYLAAAQAVTGAKVFDINQAQQYVEGAQPEITQAAADRDQAKRERVAKGLGLSEEEAGILFGEESSLDASIKDENKKEKVRNALLETGTESQGEVPDVEGATANQQKDIDSLKKVDLSLLSADQLKFYINAVERLATNQDFGGLGNFTAIVKAQQDFKVLQNKMKDSNILNLNLMEANIDSLPVAMQAITGLPTDAANFQLYFGMKGINDATVTSLDAEQNFVSKIKELESRMTKLYGKKNNGFSNESIIRQGIYSELIRYGEDQDPAEALEATKEAIQQTIENHRRSGESKEADLIERLYKPFAGLNTATQEDVMRIMKQIDPAGHKIIETAIEQYEPLATPLAEYNERFFNKKTVKSINYSGPRKWRNKGSQEVQEEIPNQALGDINSFVTGAAKPRQVSSAKEFKNLVRKDAVLDFNKHHNMANGIKRVVFGMESITPMLQVRENLKRQSDVETLFGRKDGDDKSIKKAESLYKKIFDKDSGAYFDFERHAAGRAIPTQIDREINKLFAPLRKLGYTLSLSGLSQIPKQATVLANVAVNLGADADLLSPREIISNPEAMADFIKGETVSMRGAQKSTFSLGELSPASSETQNNLEKYFDTAFEGWLGIKPLVKTDVAMAKMTYLAFYKQYLRKQGVQYEGLVAENSKRGGKVRQEARSYAKQKTDTLQVASNPAELGIKMKDQSFAWQAVKAALLPFGTFSSNAKSRMWQDWRAVFTGNSEQRKLAAKDLVATSIEQGVFHTTSAVMKLYLWGAFGHLVAGMFDLPEDKEKDSQKAWDNAVKVWKTNLVIDNLPLILTAPGEDLFIGLANKAAQRLSHYDDPNYKPLYRYEPGKDDPIGKLAELTGVYGVFLERMAKASEVTAEGLSGTRNVKGHEKKLTPEQQEFAMFVSILYGLNIAGKMPADVLFAIDRVRNKQKPGKKH